MTKYFFTFIDKFKVYLAIAAFVLLGGLIAGGPISVYYQHQLKQADEKEENRVSVLTVKFDKLLDDKDKQIKAGTDQSARLTEIIEKRLPLIVAQQDQNTDQLGQLATVVDDVATKTQKAANTASRAAGQASNAVKRSKSLPNQAPKGSIRLLPQPRPKNCWGGRDIFGDICK